MEGPGAVFHLKDRFGRILEDLRISLTDRCNFRCVYCMPAEGLAWHPKHELLTYEELLRLAGIFLGLGVRTIRLTGGEPLLRQDLEVLVGALRRLQPDLDLAITTNGFLLQEKVRHLAAAGLTRVNVSLDSLRRDRLARMVRRTESPLDKILAGLWEARASGLSSIKLNCVVLRGVNDDELVDFARFGREQEFQVRFIEFMPLDGQKTWSRQAVVSRAEILDRIHAVLPLVPAADYGTGPAEVYPFADGRGSIGVIAAVKEPFCDHCNRIRLTADGQLRTCLFSLRDHDLKEFLRSGASDQEIADFVLAAAWEKEPGHRIGKPDFVKPARSMAAIGG
jgi:GTP 3',8-cyclase